VEVLNQLLAETKRLGLEVDIYFVAEIVANGLEMKNQAPAGN
jgi:hypothetical protein